MAGGEVGRLLLRAVMVGPYPLVADRHPTNTRCSGYRSRRRSQLACSGGVINPGQVWLSTVGRTHRHASRHPWDHHGEEASEDGE
ncbi:hypothetical protein [Micromonospora sp. KLBMP9576]|uniref:hypothetical protein n=1 Tax=Micromonospora sp. KLBMP9576 TaxID=3424769 RepID=UPI003D94A8F3